MLYDDDLYIGTCTELPDETLAILGRTSNDSSSTNWLPLIVALAVAAAVLMLVIIVLVRRKKRDKIVMISPAVMESSAFDNPMYDGTASRLIKR